MPRDLSNLPLLRTAGEVIACLSKGPLDRVLLYGNDLGPDDWDGCLSTRTDFGVWVIRSIRAVGVATIDEFVQVLRTEGYPPTAHPGEIAVVEMNGWSTPNYIRQLIDRADERKPGCALAGCGYEGLFVLANHPAAEEVDLLSGRAP